MEESFFASSISFISNVFESIVDDVADLLLFDEPYSSLDEDGILLVDQLITEIKTQNKSAILVLHDNQKAKIHGDYILRLESGNIFKKDAS